MFRHIHKCWTAHVQQKCTRGIEWATQPLNGECSCARMLYQVTHTHTLTGAQPAPEIAFAHIVNDFDGGDDDDDGSRR